MKEPFDELRFNALWDAMALLSYMPEYNDHNKYRGCTCRGCYAIGRAIDYLCEVGGFNEE